MLHQQLGQQLMILHWCDFNGFSFSLCDRVDLLPCSTSQCQNGGSCYRKGAQSVCLCAPGYTGQHCETGNHIHRNIEPSFLRKHIDPILTDERCGIMEAYVLCLQMLMSASQTRVWTEPPVWMEWTPSAVSACPATQESSVSKVSCIWEWQSAAVIQKNAENQGSTAVLSWQYCKGSPTLWSYYLASGGKKSAFTRVL